MAAPRLAVAAACLALVLIALPCSAEAADVRVGTHPIYTIHLLEKNDGDKAVGTFTLTTGPQHPLGPGKNVLYGNGIPGTSSLTVRQYPPTGGGQGAEYVQDNSTSASSASFTKNWLGIATPGPVVENISGGFRTTYTTASLTIVQDVTVVGSTLADSRIIVSTKVKNNSGSDVHVGVRYLWDYQIGSDDGPTFQEQDPDGPVEELETEFVPPTFDTYKITDNDTNPGAPTYSVLGTAGGPSGLNPAPTPPDVLQAACWADSRVKAFDYTPGADNFADVGGTGCGDMSVNYLWGVNTGIQLAASGGETTVSASPVATSGAATPLGDPEDDVSPTSSSTPPGAPRPPTAGGQPDSRRSSATTVGCDRGPDPRDDFICTATVSTPTLGGPAPGGTLRWRITEKGKGFFRYGSTCPLIPSPTPFRSNCSVVVGQGPRGIGAGTIVPVVASYPGDASYKPSDSNPPQPGFPPLPRVPVVCKEKRTGDLVTYECKGVHLTPCERPTVRGEVLDYVVAANVVGPGTNPEPKPKPPPCRDPNSRTVGHTAAAAGRSVVRAATESVPRAAARRRLRKGDVRTSLTYSVPFARNRATGAKIRRALRAHGLARLARRSGFVVASGKATIPFAQHRTIKVSVRKRMLRVLKSLARAGARTLRGRLKVSIRRGDGRRNSSSDSFVLYLRRR